MSRFTLDTPFTDIPGVGQKFLRNLSKLKLHTVRDLLWHFPSRYEDFSRISKIADLAPGEQVTIQGIIEDIDVRRAWRKRMTLVEAVVSDESGSIQAMWFNQPYLGETLRPGRRANFSGTVSVSREGVLYLRHPAYEFSTEKKTAKHTARLVSIYPETKGLTSRGLRYLLEPILARVERIEEYIPQETLKRERLPEINRAINTIHFPERLADADAARRRFTFENLFLLQLVNLEYKSTLKKKRAPSISSNLEELRRVIASLPFTLTFSQKKSLWEILQDLEKPHPMNRLLQGDVGSGKTVVAALAAFAAAKRKYQTALMTPTEILAHQHFSTFEKLLGASPLWEDVSIGLLTGNAARIVYGPSMEKKTSRKKFFESAARGEVSIVIGTHALISGKQKLFRNLGLVVIDEQHRFGVKQRAALLGRANPETALPHFLSMSATPIPRTLMLTVFGDLDVSRIAEIPTGRKQVVTSVVPPEDRASAYSFIREEVKKGRQVFVICPRIAPRAEENTPSAMPQSPLLYKKLEIKSVNEEYEKLSKKIFPDLRVALLHGQLPAKEKNAVMEKFRSGETDVLVTTSVVEVGVDVPNATVMMIESSERFGLAQLYQFRGRVGRGIHQSHCFLFTETDSATAKLRLKAIIEAKNGSELAEQDLKIRGPGEFMGKEQSGFPDAAMDGLRDLRLVEKSRSEASATLVADPALLRLPRLRERVDEMKREIHFE